MSFKHHMIVKETYTVSTLLKVDSSPMGGHSISRKLTNQFVETWVKAHPGGKVISRDLTTTTLSPVNGYWIAAIHTPPEARTTEQKQVLAVSDNLIGELQQADEYVFGVPMHNFSIPSALKLWIDQVVRAGKTFSYGPTGVKPLLSGKKVTFLVASGAAYGRDSAMASFNFVGPYLLTVFGFIGVTDAKVIAAEGTAQLRNPSVDHQAFLAPLIEQVQSHASL
jgi:FMN-dependent NADH-azoreductase